MQKYNTVDGFSKKRKFEQDYVNNIGFMGIVPNTSETILASLYTRILTPKNFTMDTLFEDFIFVIVSKTHENVSGDFNMDILNGKMKKKPTVIKFISKLIDEKTIGFFSNFRVRLESVEVTEEETTPKRWFYLAVGSDIIGPGYSTKLFSVVENNLIQKENLFFRKKDFFQNEDENSLSKDGCAFILNNFYKFNELTSQIGFNIFHYVCCFNTDLATELLQKMIQKSASRINDSDEYGNTPLHYAQYYNNKKNCVTLMEAGAQSDIVNFCGFTHEINQSSTTALSRMESLLKLKNVKKTTENEKMIHTVIENLTSFSGMMTNYISKDADNLEKYYNNLKMFKEFNNEKSDFKAKKAHPLYHRKKIPKMNQKILTIKSEIIHGSIENEIFGLFFVVTKVKELDNIKAESFTDTMSPFSTMINSRSGNNFQLALSVGPWLFEWDKTSFVVPKKNYFNAASYIAETGGKISRIGAYTSIARVIMFVSEWNKRKTYDSITCNPRHFMEALYICCIGIKLVARPLSRTFAESGISKHYRFVITPAMGAELLLELEKYDDSSLKGFISIKKKINAVFIDAASKEQEEERNVILLLETKDEFEIFLGLINCLISSVDFTIENLLLIDPDFLFILMAYDRLNWLEHFDGILLEDVSKPLKGNPLASYRLFHSSIKPPSYKWWELKSSKSKVK